MSVATTNRVASGVPATAAPEFVCAEVWGGNRPINSSLKLPGIVGHVYSHPCEGGRGGDIHYVSICSSGLTSRLCLADVAGHGAAVAKVSGEIHRLLRKYMNNHDETRVLADLNRRLMDSTAKTMTTAVSVGYLPPLRLLSVSYAGHPPGWLYRKSEDRWSRLEVASTGRTDQRPMDLPLAIDETTAYSRRRMRMGVGDRLVLVTDGVLEAPGSGGELFGEARLAGVLDEHRGLGADALAEQIVAAVVEHTGDAHLSHDDVTLLVAEFRAGPRAFGVWEILKNRVLRARRRPLRT